MSASRNLLCDVFHSKNLHGAHFEQHAIKNDVIHMYDKLANAW